MINRLQQAPLLTLILASVGIVLLAVQTPGIVASITDERAEIERAATRQANAAIDMLEAVHVQSMIFRGQTADGDPAIETLNGSVEQFSNVSQGTRLWLFMGKKVVDFQTAAGETEVEPPVDALDKAVAASGREASALEGTTFRLSRPVVMGEAHAANPRCAECHTALMNIQKGEVIGGYSAAVDLSTPLAHWRAGAMGKIGWGVAIFVLTVAAIFLLLKTFALRPLKHLSGVTEKLAAGRTDVEINLDQRHDAIGAMARALRVFRNNLIANRELEEANETANNQLRYLAMHDALTGLANRTLFAEKLEAVLARCRTTYGKLAVLCLDLDRFKEVNDTLGHGAGDRLLRIVADRLREAAGVAGIVARFGGDEFALVVPDIKDTGDVDRLCERLVATFSQPVDLDGRLILATVSIGAAIWPLDGDAAQDLLKHADVALYQAKADGRNTYRFFAPAMNAAVEARRTLEADLHQAFEGRQLELHYQPLVDVRSNRIIGVEALMRWNHPEKGWISPAVFIPVAETCGLIGPMGRWLLETACQQAALWPDIVLSVNVSPAQFKDKDFAAFVAFTLERSGLEPKRLEIEITEGILLDNSHRPLEVLSALKQLGVKIAMDDFGTGYSSLGYLRSFPFDKIKIDRSFVGALETDGNAAAIVKSVLALGQSLGMKTTAEGVETVEQLAFLQSEGCDQVQGYYLAKPQGPLHLTALLGAWDSDKISYAAEINTKVVQIC